MQSLTGCATNRDDGWDPRFVAIVNKLPFSLLRIACGLTSCCYCVVCGCSGCMVGDFLTEDDKHICPPSQAPSWKSTGKDRPNQLDLEVKTGCSHHTDLLGPATTNIVDVPSENYFWAHFGLMSTDAAEYWWCYTARKVVGWKIIVTTMYM